MTARPKGCSACAKRGKSKFTAEFDMAFQPIVDVGTGQIFAHEALVRGPLGEPAGTVLSLITPENQYGFDQSARVKAIERAAECGLDTMLSINFMPNAVYEPRNCIQTTLWAADKHDFPIELSYSRMAEFEAPPGTHEVTQ